MATPTSTAPSMATTSASSDGDGPTSRPLLFFVALGFGVVFTNLWIIVGVKYCFRYNQRARQALIDSATGEPIDLNHMARPRRRREKKLMSMEDVNERFPLTKYKLWRAAREYDGLPSTGGINPPSNRPASIKDSGPLRVSADRGTSLEEDDSSKPAKLPSTTVNIPKHDSSSEMRDFAETIAVRKSQDEAGLHLQEKQVSVEHTENNGSTDNHGISKTASLLEPVMEKEEADDEDLPQSAVPADLLVQPGDACAICLETLGDDDEVRGLTCGHAFHAGCLDPWLTSRRACCPLCKADYYVPKPRGDGEALSMDDTPRRIHPRITINMATTMWLTGRTGVPLRPRPIPTRSSFPGRNDENRIQHPLYALSREQRVEQPRSNEVSAESSTATAQQGQESGSQRLSFLTAINSLPRARLSPLRFPSLPRRPAQHDLEAGGI